MCEKKGGMHRALHHGCFFPQHLKAAATAAVALLPLTLLLLPYQVDQYGLARRKNHGDDAVRSSGQVANTRTAIVASRPRAMEVRFAAVVPEYFRTTEGILGLS